MPITNRTKLSALWRSVAPVCRLSSRASSADTAIIPKRFFDAGNFYATEQIMDLIDHDVRGIHLYTMNNVETATRISEPSKRARG